jgi:predicted CDP-diglyceride synthetase/phosphatidate cytidylyltransferase
VPVTLFLVVPVFLSIGPSERGLLDAMGRTLLGVLFFVFCIAHLGLLADEPQPGLPQLFAILVIAAELPQRLLWRSHAERGWIKMMAGMLIGAVFAVALGFWLGPQCGLVEEDAGRAGLLVAIAVTLGAQVSDAVRHDLALSASSSSLGRGAFLTRSVPAVYAAPVFFHYLNHFA